MLSVMLTHQHRNVKCMTTDVFDFEYLSEEEYHSLKETYKFMCDLIDPKKYPAIPAKIRKNASYCMRNYPAAKDWDKVYETVGFFNPE